MIANGLAVSSGLRAAVLALPLAVFPGLRSPYEQPKAWWLQVIVVVTALAFILERAQHAGTPSTADADKPLIVLRWLLAAYALWWLLATVMSVVPGQSLLGGWRVRFSGRPA